MKKLLKLFSIFSFGLSITTTTSFAVSCSDKENDTNAIFAPMFDEEKSSENYYYKLKETNSLLLRKIMLIIESESEIYNNESLFSEWAVLKLKQIEIQYIIDARYNKEEEKDVTKLFTIFKASIDSETNTWNIYLSKFKMPKEVQDYVHKLKLYYEELGEGILKDTL